MKAVVPLIPTIRRLQGGGGQMGSVSNPFANYKDCSQGICSVYCSQWCYIIFPPPPPNYLSFDDNNGDDSGPDFSPLIIAVIGILASAFLLITYYTIISRYCRRRGDDRDIIIADLEANGGLNDQPWQQPASSTGLDDVTIKSITICKYKKGDGLVEGTDCSVCLSEFQEDESLRLLPKCNHAFHLPCIDTWLKSNSSCPLCRSNITIIATTNSNNNNNNNTTARAQESQASIDMAQHRMNDTIIVVQDLFERSESVVEQEAIENHVVVPIKTSYNIQAIGDGDQRNNNNTNELVIGQQQYLRRCMSLDSSSHQGRGRISIADILSISNEEEEDDHLHMLQNLHSFNGDHLNLVVIKRSVSTGGFMSSRHGEKEEIF